MNQRNTMLVVACFVGISGCGSADVESPATVGGGGGWLESGSASMVSDQAQAFVFMDVLSASSARSSEYQLQGVMVTKSKNAAPRR